MAVRALLDVLRQYVPNILFLAETLIVGVQQNLRRVGFDNFFECPPIGRSGGLTLAWKQGVDLDFYLFI